NISINNSSFTNNGENGVEIEGSNNILTINNSVFSNNGGEAIADEGSGNTVDPFTGFAGLSQTPDVLLAPNTQYTLEVEVGNAAGSFQGFDLIGFSGYWADNNTFSIAEGTLGTSTVTYNSTANDPLLGEAPETRLINLLESPGLEVSFDNVQLRATQI
ncbi:MAG TPA: hypothetical protein DCP31_13920, partial [Cyanobacteria bacterium UBA8543]|nr:hypothetical protein [Cyanobacteria bacterium UBA8543]